MKALIPYSVAAAALIFAAGSSAQEKVQVTLRVLDADTGEPVAGYRALALNSGIVPGRPDGEPDGRWTGNSLGETTVEFKGEDATGYRRRLQIFHPGYVSFEKGWNYFPQSPSAPIVDFPNELTVKLEHGVTIGGVVLDEGRKPLVGVKIIPLRHTYGPGASQDSWPVWPLTYDWNAHSDAPHAESDAAGRWQLDHFPKAFHQVAFACVRPDQSYVTIYTATSPEPFGRSAGPVIPLSDFLSRKAEISLPRGETVRGIVVGVEGEPLAEVTLSERHGRNPGIVARSVTGTDGRFTLPNRPAKEIVLVVRAPGRALLSKNVFVAPNLPEFRLVLRPAQGFAARIVDGEGRPITGARVALNQYGTFTPLEWDGTETDSEGRFRWDAAPFEPTEIFIVPTNAAIRKVTLRAGEPERTIVIRPEQAEFIRLTGAVVDMETKEPVKEFTVASAGADTYAFTFKAEGRAGKLDMKLPLKAWRKNFSLAADLQIMADGYTAQPIGRVDFYEGDREYHVELKRGINRIEGVVLRPDGVPADAANMELTRGGSITFLNRPGEFQQRGRESERVTTGANGKYSFASDPRNKSIVVVHSSGFAANWSSNLVGAASIQLQEWAQISGVAKESGKPLANENVSLRSPSGAHSREGFGISYSTTTDSEGRFTFERVPAGRYVFRRRVPRPPARARFGSIEFTHAQGVSVVAGEKKEVVYGGNGRPVIGMAQSDPPGLAVDWQWDINFLTPVRQTTISTQPNFYDYATQESYMAARERFRKSDPGDAAEAESRYHVRFDSDGRFQVTDVPPGEYEFAINLTERQADRQRFMMRGSGKSIGSTRQILVVPDGPLDQPVDAGIIPVRITANLPQAVKLPPIEALTLDGEPLRAADFKGKHLALVFWAGWCRASAESIPDFEKIYSDFHGNPRFAMVGVSLDESTEAAREHADKLSLKWATGWLDQPGRLRLMETYGVNGIPSAFLLDPSGKIAARDLKPASLRAALDRALKGN